jgi:hypothetical protein
VLYPALAADTTRMSNEAPPVSLLAELDTRQDDLLDELDALNGRIEAVIKEWTAWRGVEDGQQKLPAAA